VQAPRVRVGGDETDHSHRGVDDRLGEIVVAVAAVTAIYLLATVSELADGATLLGAIPVDMRDRIVHPLIAVLGAIALVIGRRRQPVVAHHGEGHDHGRALADGQG